MAKGRGDNRKKDARRARTERRAAERRAELHAGAQTGPEPAQPAGLTTTATSQGGLAALRGPISNAYRAWVTDYGRRQAQDMAEGFPAQDSGTASADLFVLAPLTSRTVGAPDGHLVSVQMGLPIVMTRSGKVAPAPDRLAVAALRLPQADSGGALAALGLGQAPDLPQPEPLFAVQLPAERMNAARAADALAWYLARAVEAGDVGAAPRAMSDAAGNALALLKPNAAPYGATPIDRALLEGYDGYGADADTDAVPLDIQAAPARGGLPALPTGVYLQDDGAPLAELLTDLGDYVIGLWPYDYFDLESLTAHADEADGPGRAVTLARLADIVRRVDEVLAEGAENEEATLAAEGRPPAWIAQETARYREARQELRATRVAQELLPRLGPVLFDLEIPPSDYAPEGLDELDEAEEDEEE
jgi:hypothetical protein